MDNMLKLIETLHGSHLFGTATPTSDRDSVVVFVPPARDILLGRMPGHAREGVSTAEWRALGIAKTDEHDGIRMPLHRFLEKVTIGEPNSVEILFSPSSAWLSEPHPLWHKIRALGPQLITRDMSRYAQFAYDQAKAFGLTPRRYQAAVDAQAFFRELAAATANSNARLRDVVGEIESFIAGAAATHGEAVGFEDIPGGPRNEPMRHVVVCSKRMVMGLKLTDAVVMVDKLVKDYGERTRIKALAGADWKALSTAMRVAGEAIELLETGSLSFPRPDAEIIKAVKAGTVPQNDVIDEIESRLDRIATASQTSSLPESADIAAAEDLLLEIHGQMVKPLLA